MRKIAIVVFMAVGLAFAGADAQAQAKFGHINLNEVVELLPETARLDSQMTKFQLDTLRPNFDYLINEYKRKDSIANGKDSIKLAPSVRNQIRSEIQDLAQQIQSWPQYEQQVMEMKEQQLVAPLYDKVIKAVQEVSKEGGYTYIFRTEALVVSPDGDNLKPAVLKKLKITPPPAQPAAPKK